MDIAATMAELLKRDRAVVLASLLSIVVLAWGYILHLAAGMNGMPVGALEADLHTWTTMEFVVMFFMWTAMMIAMMLPSATPMLLVFSSVARTRRDTLSPISATGAFLLGYFTLWTVFSLLATVAQLMLHSAALLSAHMSSLSPILSGVLLLVAGVYQFTPLKNACLSRCRTPLGFLLTEWRDGLSGAFHMGIRHGLFCLGCCWLLMALLFVAGVMSILWIAVLAIVVLAEKAMTSGEAIGRGIGVCAIGWGFWLLGVNLGS